MQKLQLVVEYQPNLQKAAQPVFLGVVVSTERGVGVVGRQLWRPTDNDLGVPEELKPLGELGRSQLCGWADQAYKTIRELLVYNIDKGDIKRSLERVSHDWRWNLFMGDPQPYSEAELVFSFGVIAGSIKNGWMPFCQFVESCEFGTKAHSLEME